MSAKEEIKADAATPAEPTETAGNKHEESTPVETTEGHAKTAEDAASDQAKTDSEAAQSEESTPSEEGEILEEETKAYKWCKCFVPPEQQQYGQDYYFLHFDTREVQWQEPNEPYWIWDAFSNNVHPSGLQQPSNSGQAASSAAPTSEPEPEYQGYNPAIHGSYDPNAPYAKYHEEKRRAQLAAEDYNPSALVQQPGDYSAVGAFNRFSGGFQTEAKSADRHNDYNKSGRQLGAYFDVDAAANVHGGKSLKDERRHQKLSKKEIQELSKKRREKKEKKRLDFYKS